MADVRPPFRIPLLVLGFASLFIGVGAGLLRLGWAVPLPETELAALHGPLMVSGFFGTVISLERAVALARRWAYLGPLASGAGGFLLILGAPAMAGQALLAAGSAVLTLASLSVFQRQRALFTFTLAAGAFSWLVGNLLWRAVRRCSPWCHGGPASSYSPSLANAWSCRASCHPRRWRSASSSPCWRG